MNLTVYYIVNGLASSCILLYIFLSIIITIKLVTIRKRAHGGHRGNNETTKAEKLPQQNKVTSNLVPQIDNIGYSNNITYHKRKEQSAEYYAN